jgi:hypothetical protein
VFVEDSNNNGYKPVQRMATDFFVAAVTAVIATIISSVVTLNVIGVKVENLQTQIVAIEQEKIDKEVVNAKFDAILREIAQLRADITPVRSR